MAIVTVNAERYKGDYVLDRDVALSALEWRWIKKISGYLPLTVEEGFAGNDPDLYLALAVIAMFRAGKIRKEEALLAAQVLELMPVDGAAIVVDFSDDEEEAEPEEAEADPEA